MSEDYLWEFLDVHDDMLIVDSFVKANSVINSPLYETILCSISGGSDSDVILDLVHRVDLNKKVKYVWFDTGLEYQARALEQELKATELYEPKLYKAVCNVFKDSYAYTREYKKFVEVMKLKEDKTQIEGQMNISDFIGG